jgi:hypothetical protein
MGVKTVDLQGECSMSEKMKTIKIGRQPFEIPAHMSAADMAEIWRDDSRTLGETAQLIVENSPRFARMIVHAWLDKHHYVLEDTDGPAYQARQKRVIEYATRVCEEQRKAARRKKRA